MRQFTQKLERGNFMVVAYRRRPKYVNGVKTDALEDVYTILHDYNQINLIVQDSTEVATQAQVQAAADSGTPLFMTFTNVEITVRPKSQWELQASGRASKVALSK